MGNNEAMVFTLAYGLILVLSLYWVISDSIIKFIKSKRGGKS